MDDSRDLDDFNDKAVPIFDNTEPELEVLFLGSACKGQAVDEAVRFNLWKKPCLGPTELDDIVDTVEGEWLTSQGESNVMVPSTVLM